MIKNEIDNINGTSTQEKKESKDDEDKNIANDDNYIDNATEYQKLYKKITNKYGFKTNGNILEEIHKKMKDKSLDPDELYDLRFVYDYLCNVS